VTLYVRTGAEIAHLIYRLDDRGIVVTFPPGPRYISLLYRAETGSEAHRPAILFRTPCTIPQGPLKSRLFPILRFILPSCEKNVRSFEKRLLFLHAFTRIFLKTTLYPWKGASFFTVPFPTRDEKLVCPFKRAIYCSYGVGIAQ
jgi:hypothetical protein